MKNNQSKNEEPRSFEVSDKIPHSDKMLLIHGIARKNDDDLLFSMKVPSKGIFISPENIVSPLALLEMLAQLCGAQHAFENNIYQKGVLNGYLVGIDNVKFILPVYTDDKLDMIVRMIFEMEKVKKVRGEIYRDDILIGQSELTLFQTDGWMIRPEEFNINNDFTIETNLMMDSWNHERDSVGQEIANSISNVRDVTDGILKATLCFKPDFVGFSGHFPQYPVLPGVMAIYAGWILAELNANKKLDLKKIKKAKFTRPVYPLDRVDLLLNNLDTKKDLLSWYSLKILQDGDLFSKCEIGLTPSKKDE